MKPLVCTQCGGTVNRNNYRCEYCGTYFEKPRYEGEILKVIKVNAEIETLTARTIVPDETIFHFNEQWVDEMVRDRLAYSLAKAMVKRAEITREPNYKEKTQEYSAKVRIVKPDYRF